MLYVFNVHKKPLFTVLLFFQESVNGFYRLARATNKPLLDDVEHQIINHQNQGLGYVDAQNERVYEAVGEIRP